MWIGNLIEYTWKAMLAAFVLAFLWLVWRVDGWVFPAGVLLGIAWIFVRSNKKPRQP